MPREAPGWDKGLRNTANRFLRPLRQDSRGFPTGISNFEEDPSHQEAPELDRSGIGGIRETQEMLDSYAQHGIVSDVEVIPIQRINEAYKRTIRSDVRYRFVIDASSLREEGRRAPEARAGVPLPAARGEGSG